MTGDRMSTDPETVMPAGIVYPINPVMERSDLAGIQETHTPDDVAGRHRQSRLTRITL